MADSGFGLSAQEYYYWAEGLANLVPVPDLPRWTPNFTGPSFIQIPEIDDSDLAVTGRAVDRSGNEVALSSATDTESPVSVIGNGSFEGQIQQAEYTGITEPRRYQMIVESADMPVATEVTDAFGDGSTDGILTSFPAQQPWVPVLGSEQAYLSDFNLEAGSWVNGVSLPNRLMTSFRSSSSGNTQGSWEGSPPANGSLLKSGLVVLQVTIDEQLPLSNIRYAIANGTNDEIQAAFEYPNVFDIDVFDSATEAYNGGRNDGNFNRGVNIIDGQFSATPAGGVQGSYAGSALNFDGYTATANNGAEVILRGFGTSFSLRFEVITGTPEQIQAGFQWPNHFTVTPP